MEQCGGAEVRRCGGAEARRRGGAEAAEEAEAAKTATNQPRYPRPHDACTNAYTTAGHLVTVERQAVLARPPKLGLCAAGAGARRAAIVVVGGGAHVGGHVRERARAVRAELRARHEGEHIAVLELARRRRFDAGEQASLLAQSVKVGDS